MRISRETWRQVEPLLGAALDLHPDALAAWLATIDATRPDVAPVLRELLATHERAERARELETVPKLAPAPPPSSDFAAGTRIGPFRLLRPLGRGGMGEVWLAEQADGRITRQVALKLPMVLQQGDTWRGRFDRERDILAKLDHPHIAHLYDAGVSDSGQPWLAMEYVKGATLLEGATARGLSMRARLELFRQVLGAVAHAHRHLVVHRDLKPPNILLDVSGQVKLLDFGIAKLLDEDLAGADARDLTRLGGRVMTLRYAAPEQASGGAITTATDLYSLGVVLHELLTGVSPYRAAREGRPLADAMLMQDETTVPSTLVPSPLARPLRGDLDAILLKAMRRDPAQRYASIEQFDDDIARHLERRPVSARAGTWRYLAGRFAIRHKLPLATAAAVLVTLAAGLVMVDQQRRVAVAERARAEKHFASVRKLANSFMFDVHDEIENLAGSLNARKTLIGTALEYLDSLAAESGDNPELALEVASAYRKLAEIFGDSRAAHLGDPVGARRNAERAAALLEAVEAREPDNIRVLREHRVLALFLGRMTLEAGDASGIRYTEKAAQIAEKIVRLPGADVVDRRNLGATLAEYGGILAVVKGDSVAAGVQLGRATEVLEALVRENPGDLLARGRLAYAYERAAMAAEVSGKNEQLARAIALLQRSIATTQALVRDDPTQSSHVQTLAKRYNNAARVMLKTGNGDGARAQAASGRTLVEQLVAGDPRNAGAASILAGALAMSSDIEYKNGQYEKAIAFARAAIAADARLPAQQRAGFIVRENVVGAMWSLAASNCALAQSLPRAQRGKLVLEARTLLEQSRAFKQELVDRKIDAREAARALDEIAAQSRKCDALL